MSINKDGLFSLNKTQHAKYDSLVYYICTHMMVLIVYLNVHANHSKIWTLGVRAQGYKIKNNKHALHTKENDKLKKMTSERKEWVKM